MTRKSKRKSGENVNPSPEKTLKIGHKVKSSLNFAYKFQKERVKLKKKLKQHKKQRGHEMHIVAEEKTSKTRKNK